MGSAARIPLSIGITGHRDIASEDVGPLGALSRQFFEQVQRKYPHTPLKVLSALAEGADRIVARVALDLGIGLLVPLPLEPDEYLKDFETAESKSDFNDLLDRAESSFVVHDPSSTKAVGGDRPACYARAGAYIARHSEILLAVWNGVVSEKEGGTSQVVRFKREGIPNAYCPDPIHHLLDPADTGPVYHIVTRRQSDTKTSGEPFTTALLFPTTPEPNPVASQESTDAETLARVAFEKICARTEEFNSDAKKLDGLASTLSDKSRGDLLVGTTPELLDRGTLAIIELYSVADVLAQWFQTRTLRALNALFALVFLALLAFEIWAHDVWPEPPALLLYIILLVVAYTAHRMTKIGRYQEKYLDYRALAEGLRVQFYWHIAGLRDGVADSYMRHQRDELDWIRNAIRHYEPTETVTDIGHPSEEQRVRIAVDYWVEEQYKYFNKTVKRDREKLHSAERQIRWLIPTGLFAAVCVSALAIYGGSSEFLRHWRPLMVLSMALPPLGAALLHGYAEKRALSSHVKRYTRILFVYGHAKRQLLKSVNDCDWCRARDLLRELGSEALEENGDWVILHRDRPLEVPHAG
jgi:hypothetical protein